ncbi:MAG: DUF4214 domain-containing protein [Acidimicrobiia bacterium]|nr:DUF4214 domain-containing protein [Acidimicrobiia bacterium]
MTNRRIRRGLLALVLAALLNGSMGLMTTPPAAALGQPPGPADTPGVNGQWGPLEDWPLVAIHAALDTKGRVVTYGTNGDGTQTGQFIYDIWTPGPSAAGGHATLPNTTSTDLFCSLQLNRPDTGEMLLFGGDNWTGAGTNNLGNPDINQLNPDTGQLTSLPGMNRSRWYATGTTLPDGSIYIQGGDGGYDRPEVWRPETGAQMLDLDTSGLNWWYPRNFVLPDGRIFGVDTEGRMYYVAADLSAITMAGRLPADRWGFGTTAVMFEPGKILQFGGATNTAVVIDANGANPVVTPIAGLSAAREWVDSTLLPDGRVLAIGGASNYTEASNANSPLSAYGVVNSAEIWDPATGQWSVETSGVAARLYHSTSLLLPDGRVLVAGGGAPGPVTNTNAEIFSPDYLTSAAGGPTVRPSITGVSSTDLAPGNDLAIGVNSNVDIGRITLVKSGSITHSFNMEQRITDLPFTVAGNTLNTTLPVNAAEVTPGYYLLTVLTTTGVPSTSTMIRIAPGAVNPNPPVADADGKISRLYQAYFLRQPDAAGLSYWVGALQSGIGLAEISDVFAASTEFVTRYGTLSDAEFVDQIYANVLGRPADAEGRGYWIGQLATGVSRGQVMLAFSESPEFIALTGTGQPPLGAPPPPPPPPPPPAGADAYRPEVHRLYLAYFLRDPDEAGLDYWTGQRTIGISLITVSDVFAASQEFVATYGATTDEQFVDLVYGNVLGRPADAEGRAYWIAQLGAGVSRGELMIGFSESPEFVALVGLIA